MFESAADADESSLKSFTTCLQLFAHPDDQCSISNYPLSITLFKANMGQLEFSHMSAMSAIFWNPDSRLATANVMLLVWYANNNWLLFMIWIYRRKESIHWRRLTRILGTMRWRRSTHWPTHLEESRLQGLRRKAQLQTLELLFWDDMNCESVWKSKPWNLQHALDLKNSIESHNLWGNAVSYHISCFRANKAKDGGRAWPSSSLLCSSDNIRSEIHPPYLIDIQVAAWLNQAYHAQMIQIGFPSFLAYQASLGRLGPQVLVTFSSPSPSLLSFTLAQTFGASSVPSANPAPAAAAAPQGINLTLNLPVGGQMPRVTVIQASDLNIYTIPPVWKRVTAETIDFLILIVLKVS